MGLVFSECYKYAHFILSSSGFLESLLFFPSGGGVVRGESRGAGHADQLRISPGGQRVSGE